MHIRIVAIAFRAKCTKVRNIYSMFLGINRMDAKAVAGRTILFSFHSIVDCPCLTGGLVGANDHLLLGQIGLLIAKSLNLKIGIGMDMPS